MLLCSRSGQLLISTQTVVFALAQVQKASDVVSKAFQEERKVVEAIAQCQVNLATSTLSDCLLPPMQGVTSRMMMLLLHTRWDACRTADCATGACLFALTTTRLTRCFRMDQHRRVQLSLCTQQPSLSQEQLHAGTAARANTQACLMPLINRTQGML